MSISAENRPRMPVVLVVEDEALVRYSVADRLRSAGYDVVEAASGEEAMPQIIARCFRLSTIKSGYGAFAGRRAVVRADDCRGDSVSLPSARNATSS
jgi:DNA-binding response OmpR family regulator